METLGDFSDVGTTSCGHVFHHRCLDEWAKSTPQPVCPTCRRCFHVIQLYFSFDAESPAAKGIARSDTKGLLARLANMEVELKRSREERDSAMQALKASKNMLKKEKAARLEDKKALENEKDNSKRTKELLEELLDGQGVQENSANEMKPKPWPQSASGIRGRHIVIRNFGSWVKTGDIEVLFAIFVTHTL